MGAYVNYSGFFSLIASNAGISIVEWLQVPSPIRRVYEPVLKHLAIVEVELQKLSRHYLA